MSDLFQKARAAKAKTLQKENDAAEAREKAWEKAKKAHYKNEDKLVREYMKTLIAEKLSPEKILEEFEKGGKTYKVWLWPSYGSGPPGSMMDSKMSARFSSPFLSVDFVSSDWLGKPDRRDERKWPENKRRYWHATDVFEENILRTDYPLGAYLKTLTDQGFKISFDHSITEGRSYADGGYDLGSWIGSKLVIDCPVET